MAGLLRTLVQQRRLPTVSSAQAKVVRALIACRTAALGGHVDVCDACGHEAVSYNSCRNRHCPKCQGGATAAWLEAQQEILLPVPYAHVVFTLPELLAPLALQNPRIVYGLLFRAASETLQQVAATPRHLGGRIGFLAILHTWGQNLLHHPHVHCVVPAGGVALDGSRWVSSRPGFFLPVRVLSRLYRGKLLAFLQEAYEAGSLDFHGRMAELQSPAAFRRLLARARELEWVVYAKPPFGGPQAVLKYLARYTHRIAISNHRLVERQACPLHVEGLSPRPSPARDVPRDHRVRASIPAARAAAALREDPILRFPGSVPACERAAALSGAAICTPGRQRRCSKRPARCHTGGGAPTRGRRRCLSQLRTRADGLRPYTAPARQLMIRTHHGSPSSRRVASAPDTCAWHSQGVQKTAPLRTWTPPPRPRARRQPALPSGFRAEKRLARDEATP